jgi:hypothetical protein
MNFSTTGEIACKVRINPIMLVSGQGVSSRAIRYRGKHTLRAVLGFLDSQREVRGLVFSHTSDGEMLWVDIQTGEFRSFEEWRFEAAWLTYQEAGFSRRLPLNGFPAISGERYSGNKHDPISRRRTAFHEICGTSGPYVEENAFDAFNTGSFVQMRFNDHFRAWLG